MRRVVVQSTAEDIKRTLEDPEAKETLVMIQPSTHGVVLEDLNVPASTLMGFDCRLSTIDLRKSGLNASHISCMFNCVVILPSQVRPACVPDERRMKQALSTSAPHIQDPCAVCHCMHLLDHLLQTVNRVPQTGSGPRSA